MQKKVFPLTYSRMIRLRFCEPRSPCVRTFGIRTTLFFCLYVSKRKNSIQIDSTAEIKRIRLFKVSNSKKGHIFLAVCKPIEVLPSLYHQFVARQLEITYKIVRFDRITD